MPLLERDGPLSSLADHWAEAQRGHGLFVCLAGEAGVGKTSLVREFIRCLGDTRILTGACDAMSTPRPLGPLMDVAAELAGDVSRAFEESANPAAAFAGLLAELDRRPTVFVIEDAHWADAATIDLLRFLSRRIGARRAMLIVTYRDDELGSHHPLRVLLGDLLGRSSPHVAGPAVASGGPDHGGRQRRRRRGALRAHRRQSVLRHRAPERTQHRTAGDGA
jgi:predicted ATPase